MRPPPRLKLAEKEALRLLCYQSEFELLHSDDETPLFLDELDHLIIREMSQRYQAAGQPLVRASDSEPELPLVDIRQQLATLRNSREFRELKSIKPASLASEDHAAVDAAVNAADAVISQKGLQDTQEGQELTDNAWDSQPFDSRDPRPFNSRFNTSGFDTFDPMAESSRQEERRRLELGGLGSPSRDNDRASHYGSDIDPSRRVRP
jgi:hypothetical protein